MKRSEINESVRREVWRCYDHVYDTIVAAAPIACGVLAVITKAQGERPECTILDDGRRRQRLPNMRDFVVEAAEKAVSEIVTQTEGAVKDIRIC